MINGINFSGSRLGAAFALPLVAWLITAVGWRISFFVLGVIGFAWALFWYAWFRNSPEEHLGITEDERQYIINSRQKISTATGKNPKLTSKKLFGSKNMWLAMIQYFCSNFTFFFCLTWLFPYLKSKFQLDSVGAGFYAAAPLIFGAGGNWISGWLVDKIYKQHHWNLSRQIPAILGFTLAAVGLLGSIYMENVLGAVLFLSLAIFGADMTLSPSWAFCIDIGKTSAGAVSGTMNMAGNLGSFVTALAFPYLHAWTGSVVTFFFIGAILNVVAIFLWMRMRCEQSLV
jgi:ACS family glucarate transporter-like MFS transporter